jgi:site-specific DNA recombinase
MFKKRHNMKTKQVKQHSTRTDETAGNEWGLFKGFIKPGCKVQFIATSNCVIYTRVSTREQAENNMSLVTQKKACDELARRKGYTVMGHFGGTYESAKSDERKEFKRMLDFVRRSKEQISFIIIYSLDRFSRTGGNAIYIAEQLEKQGIQLIAVTQPADTSTASGKLQQNIQFVFSEFDNAQRREKCVNGMRESLLRGDWCIGVPTGYSIIRKDGVKTIEVNEQGHLIRQAFEWKAAGMSIEDIRRRLLAQGLKLYSQRLSEIFRNMFYCGLISHGLIGDAIVEGKHEAMISRELFLKVNGLLSVNHQGYKTTIENEEAPLKRFLKCDDCGKFMRAYRAWKNKKFYYKCNTPGCKCNQRSDNLHQSFRNLLGSINIPEIEGMEAMLKMQMIATYNQRNKEKQEERAGIEKQLNELKSKLVRLEERFVEEEIEREMFLKYRAKYREEITQTEAALTKTDAGVSNLEKLIEKSISLYGKLSTVWDLGDYNTRQKLQFWVFPDGIRFNKKNGGCRTETINPVILQIAALAKGLGDTTNRKSGNDAAFSGLVENAGVEPATFPKPFGTL